MAVRSVAEAEAPAQTAAPSKVRGDFSSAGVGCWIRCFLAHKHLCDRPDALSDAHWPGYPPRCRSASWVLCRGVAPFLASRLLARCGRHEDSISLEERRSNSNVERRGRGSCEVGHLQGSGCQLPTSLCQYALQDAGEKAKQMLEGTKGGNYMAIVDGRFRDDRWVNGRWDLSQFAGKDGVTDWDKARGVGGRAEGPR